MIGSSIRPRFISHAFKRPVWSPEKITFQRTVIATPAVILGEYKIRANIVLGTFVRLQSAHASTKDKIYPPIPTTTAYTTVFGNTNCMNTSSLVISVM